MMSMSAAADSNRQVPPDGLVPFYHALAKALLECGYQQVEEVVSQQVVAECVQCQLQLGGGEWRHLAVPDVATDAANPKLKRLRLGYCGRTGCESSYYTIKLGDGAKVDWSKVMDKMSFRSVGVPAAEESTAPTPMGCQPARSNRWKNAVAVAVFILVLLFCWRYFFGGKIPLLDSKPKYRVDPSLVREMFPDSSTPKPATPPQPQKP